MLSFILTVISLALAASPTESHLEHRVACAIAFLSAAVTLTLLTHWGYALHLWGMGFGGGAVGLPFFHPHSHSVMGWASVVLYCPAYIIWGWELWKQGAPFAATRGKEWQGQRSQVREWFATLDGSRPMGDVVEVNSGSFWTGYVTYRLLNEGNFWAVAKFKKGNLKRLIEFRVHDISAVQITAVVDGKRIELHGRLVGHCAG